MGMSLNFSSQLARTGGLVWSFLCLPVPGEARDAHCSGDGGISSGFMPPITQRRAAASLCWLKTVQ